MIKLNLNRIIYLGSILCHILKYIDYVTNSSYLILEPLMFLHTHSTFIKVAFENGKFLDKSKDKAKGLTTTKDSNFNISNSLFGDTLIPDIAYSYEIVVHILARIGCERFLKEGMHLLARIGFKIIIPSINQPQNPDMPSANTNRVFSSCKDIKKIIHGSNTIDI